jgi:hypothetical protein
MADPNKRYEDSGDVFASELQELYEPPAPEPEDNKGEE